MSTPPSTAPRAPLPRLEMDQLDPELARYLQPRVQRLQYLGEFFKCMGHQPRALLAFMEFTEEGKSGLPKRQVELIALTAAGWMGNAYERNQHERLSMRLGFGRDWLRSVNALDPEHAAGLEPTERKLQAFVLGVLDSRGHGMAGSFSELVAELGSTAAVAVLMVIGGYIVHGLIVNTLGLVPPVPSVFEDGFTP